VEPFPRCGEIYLVKIPNQPSDLKERPALIVSLDIRNKLAGDVIAIPLSTHLRQAPTHVFIPKGVGGLQKDSVAKCEQITTLDKSFLLRGPFSGRVSEKILQEIHTAILNALGIDNINLSHF
jgi:mRNA interferase MazF